MSNEQETNIPSFLTSVEIAHLTQTAHKFVLKRASERLIKAGINPNDFGASTQTLKPAKLKGACTCLSVNVYWRLMTLGIQIRLSPRLWAFGMSGRQTAKFDRH